MRRIGARRIGRIPYLSAGISEACRMRDRGGLRAATEWSLDRMLLTWWPAVFVLMNRRAAISAFDKPSPRSARTSRSRS